MKRVIGLVFICGAASCVATAAAPAAVAPAGAASPALKKVSQPSAGGLAAQAAARAAVKEAARQAGMKLLAPGDEYFGPLKVSIIGIRNTLRDLGLRYDVNHDTAKQTFASAQLIERSIRDWQHRYPKDDQLPRAVYLLQRLYTKVLSQASRDRARVTAQWLAADFGRSPQARQLSKTLALEHLAPLPPEATPTPAPETYRSIFGPDYPSEFAPLPTESPTPPAGAAVRASSPAAAPRTARPALPALGTAAPSAGPSGAASAAPSAAPSGASSLAPSPEAPTPAEAPSARARPSPLRAPSAAPSVPVSAVPSAAPSAGASAPSSPAAVSPAPSGAPAASPSPTPGR